MRFLDLKSICIIFLALTYAAVGGFQQVNRGSVNQVTYVTSAAATTTMLATGNQAYIVEGSAVQTLKLPSAISLPIDWWYRVYNNSTNTVTVNDNSGALVSLVSAGRVGDFYLKAKATAAGTWKFKVQPASGDIITDHGLLTGLGDDDHPQYHNDTRGDVRYFQKTEFIGSSAGAADAAKPIKTNASGLIDNSMLPSAAVGAWSNTGNAGLTAGTNFLGTTDLVDLVFKTNNVEGLRLTATGNVTTLLTASRPVTTNQNGTLTTATMNSAFLTATSPLQQQIDVKQDAGNYITALTGDVTASGPGSAPATIAALAVTNGKIANSTIDLTAKVTGVLPLANGGTNKNMTAVSGGLVYTDSDSQEVSAAGTAGQAAISGGTGAPTFFAPTAGSVFFAGASGILSQNNANFFWKNSTQMLGIGTTSPRGYFDVINTADSLLASPTIAGSGGSDNDSWLLYANMASTFSIWNRNQLLVGFQQNSFGNIALGAGASFGHPLATVLISSQTSATTTPSLVVTKSGAQTSDLQDWNTDDTTSVAKVDITGKGFFANLRDTGLSTGIAHVGSSGDFTSSAVVLSSEVTGTLPIANGGTGQTSAANAFDSFFKSVATTLGDLVYGGTSGAPTRLAGDTSNTRKFLRELSSSSVATAPVWDTIATGDVAFPTTSALASTAAVTIDWNVLVTNGGLYTKTLAANTTFTFANPTAGQTIIVRVTNTASNFTVAWGDARIKWAAGTTPTETVGAKSDVITFIYDGTSIFANSVQNF